MSRQLASSFLAFLFTFLVLGATGPAFGAQGAHYRAEPATAQAEAKLVVRDLVWKCTAAGCLAGRSHSRPEIDCSALARQIGPLKSFAVAGRALGSAALEKCNARAR